MAHDETKPGVESGTKRDTAETGSTETIAEGGSAEPISPDPGDPGGMGGARARSRTPGDRPPGGVSPLGNSDDS